jgi:hypothetical protein
VKIYTKSAYKVCECVYMYHVKNSAMFPIIIYTVSDSKGVVILGPKLVPMIVETRSEFASKLLLLPSNWISYSYTPTSVAIK